MILLYIIQISKVFISICSFGSMNNSMLLEAVKNFGSPLYIYDSNKIKKQYERLISSFSAVKQLQINYARVCSYTMDLKN